MNTNGNGKLMMRAAGEPNSSRNCAQMKTFDLTRDQWGQLVLTDNEGQKHANVTPIALFPISEPDAWISIRDADGAELACVAEPHKLTTETWKLLKEEMARREFVPVIERIVRVSGNSEPCEWQVETDRGPSQFVLKSEEDVRRIGDEQILIVDAHGTRYHIPDLSAMDVKSRRIVEWYV